MRSLRYLLALVTLSDFIPECHSRDRTIRVRVDLGLVYDPVPRAGSQSPNI